MKKPTQNKKKTTTKYLDFICVVFPRLPGIADTLRRVWWDRSIDVFKIRVLTKTHIYLFDHDAAKRDTLCFWIMSYISQLSQKYTVLCICEHLSIQTQASKNQENKSHKPPEFLNHELLLPASGKINPALVGMLAYYFNK